jgi:hypothetical protein
LRKTGYLGEGGYLMRNNLYGMSVERTNVYQVHELRVKGWQMAQGQSIEDFFGVKKGQKVILGYQNGNPVTAGGKKNYIENVFEMGDGKLGIKVRETVPFGTGTKVDPVKGLVHGVTDNEWERIKEGMNRYHQATGSGGYIPTPLRPSPLRTYITPAHRHEGTPATACPRGLQILFYSATLFERDRLH